MAEDQETNQENLPEKVEQKSTALETKEQTAQRNKLPYEALEKFTKQLNLAPRPNSVAKHQGYEYIPISFIEKDLLKLYFGLVQFEIISYQQVLNEFVVHARIRVYHPIIREWLNYDGIGAGMFQQKADTPIQDFFMHKTKNAGKLTVPNAYAEALKNGAKKIGKRFGSDLNRKHEDYYEGFIKEKEESESLN